MLVRRARYFHALADRVSHAVELRIGAGYKLTERVAERHALVVSLGFDASLHEPLQFFTVSSEGFSRAGEAIAGLKMKTRLVQQGGYATGHLGSLLRSFLDGF